MLNQALRYPPLLEALEAGGGSGPILEVGAGSNGLARFVDHRPVIGVDLKFARTPHPRLSPVIGSALSLPFLDGAFDDVVSCDMLEHLSPTMRAGAVREMLRVSRSRLILAFPAGAAARDHDRWLDRRLRRLHFPYPDWLHEHLDVQPPSVDEVVGALAGAGEVESVRGNVNAAVHRSIALAEQFPPIGFTTSRLIRSLAPLRVVEWLTFGEAYRAVIVIRPRDRTGDPVGERGQSVGNDARA
jgi:hypothetical protein